MQRTYIETCLDLPWNTSDKISINLEKAEKILDKDCLLYTSSLGGEKTLAMGCDFDGGELPNFLQDIGDLERLGTYFSQMGLNDRVIDQIFYQNAKEFFDSL